MLSLAVAQPRLMTVQCVTYFGFADDVMFPRNGANTDRGHWQIIHHDSPGGATELHT